MKTSSSRFVSRQRFPLFVSTLCALALSTGCAVDAQEPFEEEEVGTSDEAVTNAYADGPHYVVNLGNCSGVAISPNYVLTAAHCFNSSYYALTVRGGLYSESVLFSGTAQIVNHPNWNNAAADKDAWDIAVVRLFGAGLGAAFPKALIYAGPETPWTTRGNGFYVAGYGQGTDPGGARSCSGAGASGVIKRGGNFAFLGTGRKSGSTWLSVNGYSSLRTTCNGDSGTPYILPRNGVDFAFAIHSGSQNVVGGTIRATMIQPKLDWIIQTAASMGVPLSCAYVRDHRTSPTMYYYNCR